MKRLLHGMRWLLLTGFLAVLLAIAIGFVYSMVVSAKDRRRYPPPGRLIDVGTHKLHLQCVGRGSPTVVLESGAGGTVLDWSSVQPLLAEITTVCAYDRAGLGWSEPGPSPRTSGAMVNELRSLLANAEVPPPYLLVGHSFGGLNMRLFAEKHPAEVVGLVLLDSVHPALNERMPTELSKGTGMQLRSLAIARLIAPTGVPRLLFPPLAPPGLPAEAQAAANALGYRSQTYQTVHDEAESFATSASEIGAMPFPSELPLVVLSRSRPEPWPPNVSSEVAESVWRELQTELAELSSNTTHAIVDDTGHYIQIEKPEVPVAAILALVERLRDEQPE